MDDAVGTANDAPSRGGRRERGKQEKLARIVRAATLLFAERGFEATTTQAIAEEAGIGAGTLFLYVRSKDDLLVRVVLTDLRHQLGETFDRIDDDAPVGAQVLGLFAELAAHQERDPALSRAFLKEVFFAGEAERAAVGHLLEHFTGLVEVLVGKAEVRGELAAVQDRRALAANLVALWFHLAQLRHGGHLGADELVPALGRAVASQLAVVQAGRRATK